MAVNPNRPSSETQTIDDLYITTLENRRAGIVDATFHRLPFYFWLSAMGRMQGYPGGEDITFTIEVDENDTVKSFSRGEEFSESDQQIFTKARYEWKQVGGSLTRFGTDDAKNTGRAAIIKEATAKVKNLEKSIRKQLNAMLMSDGTGNNGRDIDGIKTIITSDGTGTVGGINSSTYPWWQHEKYSPGDRQASLYLLDDLTHLYNTIGGDDQEFPDFHFTTQAVYEAYEAECREIHQLVNKTMADAGFDTLAFKGKPVVWMSQVPEGYWYMVNSDYLEFSYNQKMNFANTGWKVGRNDLKRSLQIVLMANLTTFNRQKVGGPLIGIQT